MLFCIMVVCSTVTEYNNNFRSRERRFKPVCPTMLAFNNFLAFINVCVKYIKIILKWFFSCISIDKCFPVV